MTSQPTTVHVQFFSWFKDLTGCSSMTESLPEGSTLDDLFKKLASEFPKLAALEKSVLIAVGLDYQDRAYRLKPGDEISIFPPVQGG